MRRAVLVETILALCQDLFGSTPTRFDIHGPYGIRKGQSVGIKAFRTKLERRGHDDYYAINGRLPGSFGFVVLFDAKTGTEHLYSELVFWYHPAANSVDIVSLALRLSSVFPSDYGFAIDLPADYDVHEESKIKRTFFGVSVKSNEQLFRWRTQIAGVLRGRVRGLYQYNFLNDAQAEELRRAGLPQPSRLKDGLSVLTFTDPDALKNAQMRYARASSESVV